MLIRKETEKDFDEIYKLVETAFKTAEVSNGKEQDFVNELRASENYIPELALVAEEDGKLVGHIMLTTTPISDNGTEHEVLYLAPVSVELSCRSRGIGSKLINECCRLAVDMGYTSVVLVGNPAYYTRFGFKQASEYGIAFPHIPDQFVMALELKPGALEGIKGEIIQKS